MPDLSSDLSTIRLDGHSVQAWLSPLKGRVSASGSITSIENLDSNTDIYSQINVTFSTGGWQDGYITDAEIEFFRSGAFLGRSRISREMSNAGFPRTTRIAIPDTSQAVLPLQSGDTFIIYDEHRIRARVPSDDVSFSPDNETWTTDDTDDYRPITNSGGVRCVWVDSGQDYATLDFTGDNSYPTNPNSGAADLAHWWQFGDDATPTESFAANPTGVRIPAGTRWITHTVFDTNDPTADGITLPVTNSSQFTGQTGSVQWIPIAVHDLSDNKPIELQNVSFSGTVDSGWKAGFTVSPESAATVSDIADGTPVAIWVQEYYNTTSRLSFGTDYGQASVKFFGYLVNDQNERTAESDTLSFSAVSPMTRLGEIVGFSRVVEDATAATNWQERAGLSVDAMIIFLLRWFTTALNVCDYITDYTDVDYPAFFETKSTPLQQIRGVLDALDCRFVTDRRGVLLAHVDPDYIPLDDRSNKTVTLTLTEDDIISYSIERRHNPVVDTMEFKGLNADGQAFFAIYPNQATNQGTYSEVQDRLIVSSQDAIEERGGRRGAKVERVFINSDRTFYHAPILQLNLRGAYDVFDLYPEYVEFDGVTTLRGVDLNDFLWHVTSISTAYGEGTGKTTLTLSAATHAPPAAYQAPPSPTVPAPPAPPIPLDDSTPDEPLPVLCDKSFGTVYALFDDGKVVASTNFDSAAEWTLQGDLGLSAGDIKSAAINHKDAGWWVVREGGAFYFIAQIDNITSTPAITNVYSLLQNPPFGYQTAIASSKQNANVAYAVAPVDIESEGQTTYEKLWTAEQLPDDWLITGGVFNSSGAVRSTAGEMYIDLPASWFTDNGYDPNVYQIRIQVQNDSTSPASDWIIDVWEDNSRVTVFNASAPFPQAHTYFWNATGGSSGAKTLSGTPTVIRVYGDFNGSFRITTVRIRGINDPITEALKRLVIYRTLDGANWSQAGFTGDEGVEDYYPGVDIDPTTNSTESNDGAIVGWTKNARPSFSTVNAAGNVTEYANGQDFVRFDENDAYDCIRVAAVSPFIEEQSEIYLAGLHESDDKWYLFRVTGGEAYKNITPKINGVRGSIGVNGSVLVRGENDNIVLAVGVDFSGQRASFISFDKGDSWKQITSLGANHIYGYMCDNNIVLYGNSASVDFSADYGSTFTSKRTSSLTTISSGKIIGFFPV